MPFYAKIKLLNSYMAHRPAGLLVTGFDRSEASRRLIAASGLPFHVRDYQRESADVFYAGGDVRGGSGVIVLLREPTPAEVAEFTALAAADGLAPAARVLFNTSEFLFID